jgi:hypothetical protein
MNFSIGDVVFTACDGEPMTITGFRLLEDREQYQLQASYGAHYVDVDYVRERPFWRWAIDTSTMHIIREWAEAVVQSEDGDKISHTLMIAYSTVIELLYPQIDTVALRPVVRGLYEEFEGDPKSFVFEVMMTMEHELRSDQFIRTTPRIFENPQERKPLESVDIHWELG